MLIDIIMLSLSPKFRKESLICQKTSSSTTPWLFDAPSPRNPRNIRTHLTFLETRLIELYFAADSMCLSSFNVFQMGSVKRFFCTSAFRPFKVIKCIDFVTNQKRVWTSYLSVIVTLILSCTVSEIFRFLCSWLHPYSSLILGVFLLKQIDDFGVNLSMYLKLLVCKIIFEVLQPIRKTYLTDGRTDGLTTSCGITALCIASSSKNCKKNFNLLGNPRSGVLASWVYLVVTNTTQSTAFLIWCYLVVFYLPNWLLVRLR